MNYTYYSAFGGIDAWGKALKIVTERHKDTSEMLGYWETDKYASNALAAVHGVSEDINRWNIAKNFNWDGGRWHMCINTELEQADIFFSSPPCTTFSLAGKQEGSDVAMGNLWYPTLRQLEVVKPKFALMENVRGFRTDPIFPKILKMMEDLGYINYVGLLNAKDYGIPQNRERVFIVSVRQDMYDKGYRFEWPKKMKLDLRLKDMLEDKVDDKYYLSEKTLAFFLKNTEDMKAKGNGFKFEPQDGSKVVKALTTRAGSRMDDNFIKVNQVGNLNPNGSFNGNPQVGRVYDSNGLSPTLSTMQGGGQEPKIIIPANTKEGQYEAYPGNSINLDQPTSKTRRGRVGKGVSQTLTTSCNQAVVLPAIAASRGRDKNNPSDRTTGNKNLKQRLEFNKDGLSNTLTSVQKDNYVIETQLKIRKLTPLECWRLMGFEDKDYYSAVESYDKTWKSGASDSQMYKRAGNSIVVNVIVEILENLLYQRKQSGNQISLF